MDLALDSIDKLRLIFGFGDYTLPNVTIPFYIKAGKAEDLCSRITDSHGIRSIFEQECLVSFA